MRARNIQPGFYKSDQLADCSLAARYIFPGLWMLADRMGRLEYRPKRIKAELLPFDDADMEVLLKELEQNDLIKTYEVDGKKYIWIPTFLEHQRPHTKEQPSKLPPHPDDKCQNTTTQVEPDHDLGDGKPLPRPGHTTTQVEPDHDLGSTQHVLNPESLNPESLNHKRQKDSCAELSCDSSTHDDTSGQNAMDKFIDIPLNTGESHWVTVGEVELWESLYPAVDVRQQLRAIKGWALANPKRRKTKLGINKCINNWLADKQNSGGNRSVTRQQQTPQKTFQELEEERQERLRQERRARAREYDRQQELKNQQEGHDEARAI